MIKRLTLGSMLLALLLVGCDDGLRSTKVYAPLECLFVQAFGTEQESALRELFEDFGENQGFHLENSHPFNPRLISPDQSIEISLGFGLGKLGANLTLWEFCETEVSSQEKFSLLLDHISNTFESISCEAFEDYRGPYRSGFTPGCYIQQNAQADAG